jgi:hypothetical protein
MSEASSSEDESGQAGPSAPESPARGEAERQPSPRRSPRRPGITTTLPDGRVLRIPEDEIERMTIATATNPNAAFKVVAICDPGFGGVEMVVEGAKRGICFISHIKINNALFPQSELESQLQGHPAGSSLIMETIIEGVTVLAIGYKFNSKKTLFFCAPKGAGATTDEGEPYVTKWPDEKGNVLHRNVLRLVLVARYYLHSNLVDRHNHLRQGELALEKKWHTDDPWFRLFCTLLGMTTIDTMLAARAEVVESSPFKRMSTRDFTRRLVEALVMNTVDGELSRPLSHAEKKRKAAAAAVAEAPGPASAVLEHILVPNEKISSFRDLKPGESDRAKKGASCAQCKKSRSFWHCSSPVCSFSSVCGQADRGCWAEHLKQWDTSEGSGIKAKKAYTTPSGKGRAL